MPMRYAKVLRALSSVLAAVLLMPAATALAAEPPESTMPAAASAADANPDAERFFRAIVKVHTRAVPDARSTATLGEERDGTGVVIGRDGLILTIGYLIIEADDVKAVDSKGRTLPARVIGYDPATGFGLVRTIVPFDATPIPLGDSGKLAPHEPVMIVNYDGARDVTLAYVVSIRLFTGNWEYLLERAIFTSPPTANWSGAALVNHDLELVGVGALIVRDASAGETKLPGNMFVPIDALKPILDDLVRNGQRAGPPRPWMGIATDEVQGQLLVARVSTDGPGERAGIQPGDIILAIGSEGVRTQADFYRRIWSRGSAGTDIPLRVLQGIDVKELIVHTIDRVDYFRPRTMY